MRKTQTIIGDRKVLVKNPLIVDGITRAGKFLMANLLSSIKDVEPVHYFPVLDHVARLEHLGLIEKKAARELLRSEADRVCYETLIGRSFNHRTSDKSSIFNNPRHKTYLKRLYESDGEAAVDVFHKNRLYNLFIVHEAFLNADLFFNSFPGMKVIVVQRSPLDLAYSWHQRKLIRRIGKDPLMGEIALASKGGSIPWHLYSRREEYHLLPSADRIVLAISTLFEMYEEPYQKLTPKHKKSILFVRYEEILLHPETTVKRAAAFLKRKILPEMKWVIKREKLPNTEYFGLRERKIKTLKRILSKKYFDRLLSLEEKYAQSAYNKTTNT